MINVDRTIIVRLLITSSCHQNFKFPYLSKAFYSNKPVLHIIILLQLHLLFCWSGMLLQENLLNFTRFK